MLTFHLVVTPGSVPLAEQSLRTFLRWTPWNFILVGNGLGPAEARSLKDLAVRYERTECLFVPEHQLLPHGIVLSRLFDQWTERFFAFSDVDVFLTGPVAEEVEAALQKATVVTAGYHVALDPETPWDGYEGKRLRGPQGETVGVSFFAVYRTRPLQQVRSRYAVGLERYESFEELPRAARERLEQSGYRADRYDTAKVVNLLLLSEGQLIEHLTLPHLHHVGGLSGALLPPQGRRARWLRRLKARTQSPALTDAQVRVPWWRYLWWLRCGRGYAQDRSGTYIREQVAEYFARVFRCLLHGTTPPPVRLSDGKLRQKIEAMVEVMRQVVRTDAPAGPQRQAA